MHLRVQIYYTIIAKVNTVSNEGKKSLLLNQNNVTDFQMILRTPSQTYLRIISNFREAYNEDDLLGFHSTCTRTLETCHEVKAFNFAGRWINHLDIHTRMNYLSCFSMENPLRATR